MAENRYTWELGLSASDLTSALKEVMSAVKGIDKALNEMGQTLQDAFDEFKSHAKPVVDEVARFGREIDRVFKGVEKDVENLSKSMRQADMSKWEKAAENYSLKIAKATKQLEEMKTKSQSLTMTDEERVKVNKQIADTQEQILRLTKEQASVAAFAKMRKEADEAKRAMHELKNTGMALAQTVRDIGILAGAAFTAFSFGVKEAVTSFGDFDATIRTFGALSSANREDLERFKQTAMDIGASSKFTAQEVALAGVELVKMGFTAKESTVALKGMVNAAVAAGEPLEKTSEIIAATIRQFGLSARDTAMVGDIISKAALESSISVVDWGESLRYVGSAARAADQPITDIASLLLILGNNGIKATTAGNGLQNALLRLQAPTSAGASALERFGVAIAKSDGSMRNIIDIIKDLRNGMQGLGKVEQAGLLKDIFGEVALNSMQVFFNTTDAEIEKSRRSMENYQGSAAMLAKEIHQGLNAALQDLAAAGEAAKISIGESLAPVIIQAAGGIQELLKAFNALPAPIKSSISMMGLLTTAALGLTAASGILAGSLIQVNTITSGALSLSASKLAGTLTGTVVPAFSSVMSAAAPFVLLAGSIYLAYETNFGGLRDIFDNFAKFVNTEFADDFNHGLSIIFGDFNKMLKDTGFGLESLGQTVKDSFKAVIGFLSLAFKDVFNLVAKLSQAAGFLMAKDFKNAGRAAAEAFNFKSLLFAEGDDFYEKLLISNQKAREEFDRLGNSAQRTKKSIKELKDSRAELNKRPDPNDKGVSPIDPKDAEKASKKAQTALENESKDFIKNAKVQTEAWKTEQLRRLENGQSVSNALIQQHNKEADGFVAAAEKIRKTGAYCYQAVAEAYENYFGDSGFFPWGNAVKAIDGLVKDTRFVEVALDRTKPLREQTKKGDIGWFPYGMTDRTRPFGHIEIYDPERNRSMFGAGETQMRQNALAGQRLFRLRSWNDPGQNQEVQKQNILIQAQEQLLDKLIAKQGQLQAMGKESKEINQEIDDLKNALGKSELELDERINKAKQKNLEDIRKQIEQNLTQIGDGYEKLSQRIGQSSEKIVSDLMDKAQAKAQANMSEAERLQDNAFTRLDDMDQDIIDYQKTLANLDAQLKALESGTAATRSAENQKQINDLLSAREGIQTQIYDLMADQLLLTEDLSEEIAKADADKMLEKQAAGYERINKLIEDLNDPEKLNAIANGLRFGDVTLEQLTGNIELTEKQMEALSNAMGALDFDKGFNLNIQNAIDEQKRLQQQAEMLADAFESGFGIALDAMNRFASGVGESTQNVINGLTRIASGVQGLVAGIASGNAAQAIAGGADALTGLFGMITGDARLMEKEFFRMTELKRQAIIQEGKILIEERKRQGKETFDLEIDLAKKTAEAQKSAALEAAQKEGAEISIFSKLFGATGSDKQKLENANRTYEQAIKEIDEQLAAETERIESERAEKRSQIKLAADQRYYSTQEALASLTADKLDDIDVQYNQRRYEIMRDAQAQIAEALEAGVTDTTEIEANKNALLLQLDKETAQERKEIQAEALKAEKEAYFDHQETLLSLQADTFDRSIELQRLALNRELAMLDIEISKTEAGSVERGRLEQQKVDAILKANAAIQKSIEDSAKARERELLSLKSSIAQLKAQISGDAGELMAAGVRQSFADIYEQEANQIENARQKYQNAEEVITEIRAMFALKREAESKRMLEEGIKTYRDKYVKQQEDVLKSQQKPLQAIIDKETLRLKEIDKQNAAYERQNQLIDERFAKEQALFDQQDKSLFAQGLSAVDLAGGLTAGANYLANEDIINGTITDRTSRETQLRGLGELLDMQAQEAESKLKLEDISQEQFNSEMTRITLMRARLIQEQMIDAQNEKERADLNQKFAEQYVAYQKLQKEAIDARRSAEKRTNDELISSNNRLKEEAQATIDFNKTKLDELQVNYDLRLRQIDEQIAGVSATSTGWIEALKTLAPTLADQAAKAIAAIKTIRDEFNKPVTVGGTNIAGSTGMTANGSAMVSWDMAKSSTIQSRDKQMVDAYGSFSVQGDNGRWYLSTSQMLEATKASNQMLGGLRAFAEGGVIPNYSHFENDGAIIRASAGERVLQTQFNRRMENMLQFFELPRGFAGGGMVNITIGNINSDVDLSKLEAVFDKHLRGRETLGVKRWGINSLSRN